MIEGMDAIDPRTARGLSRHRPFAVHRDPGPDPLQPVDPGKGRELTALSGVHDLGRAERVDRLAALSLAQEELARQQLLRSRRVGTQRDLDRAAADVERAQAAVDAATQRLRLVREGFRQWQTRQAEAELGRAEQVKAQSDILVREAELRAPADAVVLHRLVEPGTLVAPGQPALTLGLAGRLFVRTFIPEPHLGRVRQGQAAQVLVDAFPQQPFAAHVTEISPTAEFTPKAVETRAERINLVFAAKVDLEAGWNASLVPGQPAEVLLVPASPVGAPR